MSAILTERFMQKLGSKDYRTSYAAETVRMGIAYQIRALREQEERDWSQTELGRRMGKPQSVISRLEDPDYGKVTLQTLLDVAAAFDLPLLVQFVDWEDFLKRTADVSSGALGKKSLDVGCRP